MRTQGAPLLMVPLPTRVKVCFLEYVRDNATDLTEKQNDMLLRYSENEQILNLVVDQYFNYWWNNDRRGRLQPFVDRYIEELLKVYE